MKITAKNAHLSTTILPSMTWAKLTMIQKEALFRRDPARARAAQLAPHSPIYRAAAAPADEPTDDDTTTTDEPRFSVGDRVRLIKTSEVGTVVEVRAGTKVTNYLVAFGEGEEDDRMCAESTLTENEKNLNEGKLRTHRTAPTPRERALAQQAYRLVRR